MLRKKKEITANEYINVLDIKDNVLYTKDGNMYMYLKIYPVSIGTMSKGEQKELINRLTAEFTSIKSPIFLFKIGSPVDISELIDSYKELYKRSDNLIQKEFLRESILFLHKNTTSGTILENQFYQKIWSTDFNEVQSLAKDFRKKMQNCNILSEICKREDIVKICNLFANPTQIHFEDDISENLSILDNYLN